jgi:ABC-type branched-subunit amino acid transport system permease subunit
LKAPQSGAFHEIVKRVQKKGIVLFVVVIDIIVGGLLMGGIYALIAVGLSLQYGVGRVLNISHGEFIMVAAFVTWTLYTVLGISPLISLAICGPFMFVIGYFIHRSLFKSLREKSESEGAFADSSLLATFGLLFIIQNIAIIIWKSDIRGYTYLDASISIFGAYFSANRIVALFLAVCISLAFYFFLTRTRMGKAIRAAAEDPETAQVMGVKIHRVLGRMFRSWCADGRFCRRPDQHDVRDAAQHGTRIYHYRHYRRSTRRFGEYYRQPLRGLYFGPDRQYRNLY